MPKYWISTPRFIKQIGDSEPQFIAASPNNPVLVEIEEVKEKSLGATLWKFDEPSPAPLLPAHAGPAAHPMSTGAQKHSTPIGRKPKAGRAADS
jgi:hypothetical protein